MWNACIKHHLTFQGWTCPRDPMDLTKSRCPVAGSWDTQAKADRWLRRVEVNTILAEAEEQIAKGYQ